MPINNDDYDDPAQGTADGPAQRYGHWRIEVENLKETAAQFSRNADYYRDLVVQIGEMFGSVAYISDDGSVQNDVLCAKVPELVQVLVRQSSALPDSV